MDLAQPFGAHRQGTNRPIPILVDIRAFTPEPNNPFLPPFRSYRPRHPYAQQPVLPPQDGFPFLDREKMPASFAADVDAKKAEFIAISHVPWSLASANGVTTETDRRTKPSWSLVANEDKMIRSDAERSEAKRAGSTVV